MKRTKTAVEEKTKPNERDNMGLEDFLVDHRNSDLEINQSVRGTSIKLTKKSTASPRKTAREIIINTDSDSTSDSDQQLFYIRTTNKIISKKSSYLSNNFKLVDKLNYFPLKQA